MPRESGVGEAQRRAQLIDATIAVVAERGYAGASLQRIAEAAQVTKPAVLYHFGSKDALVRAAQEHVLAALVEEVGAAVDAAPPGDGPSAYVLAMVAHLRAHPLRTRTIVEAMAADEEPAGSERRWSPLADLLAAARGGTRATHRGLAIAVGGGIDAIVLEQLADPGFDGAAAAEQLAGFVGGDA